MEKIKLTPVQIFYAVFIAVEIIIYITFNILSAVLPDDPIYAKYAGVLLCLAASGAAIYFYKHSKDSIIVTCAMVATAISDLFILVLDDYYEVGLITFLITQSLYLYRLYAGRYKKIWITLVARAAVAAALLITLGVLTGLNFLLVEVAIYIVMLAGNLADAVFICVRKGRTLNGMLFAVGLFLFLCCDICVGFHNGSMVGISLTEAQANVIQYLIWIFYLPSQVLIACSVSRGRLTLSGDNDERKEQENS